MCPDAEKTKGLLLVLRPVPHDRLFLDAIDRDLKRERRGIESTTEAGGEPALSFRRDPRQSLFEQVSAVSEAPSPTLGEAAQPLSGPAHPAAKSRRANIPKAVPTKSDPHSFGRAPVASTSEPPASISSPCTNSNVEPSSIDPHATRNVFGVLVLKGAPTYKQHVRASGRTSDGGAEVGTVNPSPSSTLVAIAKTNVCSESDCGISFKRSEHRSRHKRTHTGEQPFACPTCAKSFSRRDNMSAHIKTHAKKATGRVDVATDSNEEVESERSSSSTGGSRSPLIEDGSGSEERRRGMSASSSRRVASLTRSPAPGANTRDVPRQTPLSNHHSVRHEPHPSSSRPRSRTSAEVSTPIPHNPSFAFGYPVYEASGLEDLDSSSFSDNSVGSHLPSSNTLETASSPARAAEGGASDFGAIGGSGGAGAGGAEERMEVDGEV